MICISRREFSLWSRRRLRLVSLHFTRMMSRYRSGLRLCLPRGCCGLFLRASFSGGSSVSPYTKIPLYRRICRFSDPRLRVVPVLDQWVEEGNRVDPGEIRNIVRALQKVFRYKHALEVSRWMTDRRYIPLETADVVTRLQLILRVHGAREAENYFENFPEKFRTSPVYISLLTCYSISGDAEKAEDLMEKMKNEGCVRTPIWYNLLLKLYSSKRDLERMDTLMLEMLGRGINWDSYTYMIRLSASAAAHDTEGVEKMEKMACDASVVMDHNVYAIVARAYVRVGKVDKALENLGKLELLLGKIRDKSPFLNLLLFSYSAAGRTEDVYRVVDIYKKARVISNKGYIAILRALMKLNDIYSAEAIFRDWERSGLSCDFRVPDILIGFYCRNGMSDKAETIVGSVAGKGGKPTVATWYNLANAYLELDQVSKAMEMLKMAIEVDAPGHYWPSKEVAESCLRHLGGNCGTPMAAADELAESLKSTHVFSEQSIDRILSYGSRAVSAEADVH